MNSNLSEIIIVAIKCFTIITLLVIFKKEIASLISNISSLVFKVPSLEIKFETLKKENESLRKVVELNLKSIVSLVYAINQNNLELKKPYNRMLQKTVEQMQEVVSGSKENRIVWIRDFDREIQDLKEN